MDGKCFHERREGKVEPIRVLFQSMEDCQRFVLAVENYPFNIDLRSGRHVIDGKSMLGILGFKTDWYVKSNREAGNGFGDIIIKIEDKGIGMIIEVKYAEDENYTPVCEGALKQIVSENYLAELRKEGYRNILKYGIACYKKRCRVMYENESCGITI